MGNPLHVLLLEDQENDALLLLHELERLGYSVVWERVDTRDGMLAALSRKQWNIIISDYAMPQFSAHDALLACKEHEVQLPFIIVSGTIDEEAAVESLRLGADDFITKSRLTRLGPAIARSRRDFEERQARRHAEARVRQIQKMEVVGQLAGGVAHDFNNLLGVIQGYGELLIKRLAGDEVSAHRLAQILAASSRGAALTRKLLAFSRQQPLAAIPLDLNPIVTAMEPMLRRLISEDIEIVTVLDTRLHRVKADPTQVEQVLMNLAVNARDAMESGGRLTIETGNVELDEAYAATHPDAEPGSFAMLAVSDTGHGMDAETLSHAFEPFYTTKAVGKGTGLGLATVYGIARQSGGHVAVYSEPGRGTTFKVYLPPTDQPDAGPVATDPSHDRGRGSETIVLVEDEPSLRSVIHDLLREGGYTVIVGESPEASVEAAEAHAGPIHLVLTDLVMPGISGSKAAARVRGAHPGAKVLYMSGYTSSGAGHQGGLPQGHPFLQKPFSIDVLLRKVREVLDAASTTSGNSGNG
jgi:two-component system, cell cycle sensor histidine kinase and response regulator CckA